MLESSLKAFCANARLLDCFPRPVVYITQNATWPLSDITVGNIPDYMQLPLEPQKTVYLVQEYSSRPVKN